MFGTHLTGRKAVLAALLGGLASVTINTQAGTPTPPGLFSTNTGEPVAELPEQALAGKSRAVNINFGQLRSGRLFLDLPGGITLQAVRKQHRDMGHGRFSWVGYADSDSRNRVVLGISGDAVAGTFAYKGRLYKLEPRANGSHILSEVDTSDPAPELDPIPVADTVGSSGEEGIASASNTTADGGPVIDVLVAYTPRIESLYGVSGTDALIIQAVAESNQAYANSGITARLNLVKSLKTSYTESGNMSTDLSRLRGTSDGYMDELHSARDSYGADLVTLIEDEPQYCGIAYRMTSNSTSFASSGFSVVHRTCATGYYSFAHEIGHNQGAHHDPANASGAMYAYGYGHQEPYNSFRTVMAYNCSSNCTRVDHFSNPNILYNGQPTGVASVSDNARGINNTAQTVANFRQQAATNAPSAPADLQASASGHTQIQLNWTDTSSEESGFYLERSEDGANFSQIANLAANTSSYLDDGLTADTLYTYRTRAWNSIGSSAYSNEAVTATETAPPLTDQVAKSDMAVAGSLSGTYQNTWNNDGNNQGIQERQSGGKRNSRYGYLEHKWTFQVVPGNSVVLFADAHTSTSNDSFTFSYSTNNSQYVNMFTVDSGSSGNQQFVLPSNLSGTIYVRVKDNVRNPGSSTSHSVQVDHILIRSENGAEIPPPAAPSNLGAASAGAGKISLNWTDNADSEYGFGIERRADNSSQWTQIATTGSNVSAFTDSGLQAATVYHYRVHAFNGAGTSAVSNSASAQTQEQSSVDISLSANGYKVKGRQQVDLNWTGAQGGSVDIYRNGSRIVSNVGGVADSGNYADNIGAKGGGSYSYQVCEAGTSTCSTAANVVF